VAVHVRVRGGSLMSAALSADERHDVVIAVMARADADGRLAPETRWIRAWCKVAGAYKREQNFAAAKRCEMLAADLMRWERGGAKPAVQP